MKCEHCNSIKAAYTIVMPLIDGIPIPPTKNNVRITISDTYHPTKKIKITPFIRSKSELVQSKGKYLNDLDLNLSKKKLCLICLSKLIM